MTGDEPPGRGRPRWSFTWLLRIQRVGRDRAERHVDDEHGQHRILWRVLLYVLVGVVLAIEVALGFWLGLLPRS